MQIIRNARRIGLIVLQQNYVTQIGKNCYFGNVINILNYYDILISESEFVVLCDALNCSMTMINNIPYIVIPRENCQIGLKRIYCEQLVYTDIFNNAPNIISIIKETNSFPILVHINTKNLSHHPLYINTQRYHYITILSFENEKECMISDAFIPTFPISSYHGLIDTSNIISAVKKHEAHFYYIKPPAKKEEFHNSISVLLYQYLIENIEQTNNSVLYMLQQFIDFDWGGVEIDKNTMLEQSFMLQVSGCITRFDYMIELFNKYFNIPCDKNNDLYNLWNKWKEVSARILKCGLALKPDIFVRIIRDDIKALIKAEADIYKTIYNTIKADSWHNRFHMYE